MKLRILAVAAMLLALTVINVSASAVSFDITVNDDYLTARKGEQMSEIAQVIGVEESKLASDFNKGGLLYLAAAPDNSIRVKLSAFADNFSVKAIDIAYLDDENMQDFLSSLGADANDGVELQESNGRKYAVICDAVSDSYTVTQYITICGGKTYYLSCYNNGGNTSDTVTEIFKSLTIKQETAVQENASRLFVAVILGVAVFGIIAVIMAVGIVRNLKFKEN